MTRRIAPLLCLALVACGSGDAPADREDAAESRQETVFDDLVEQREELPARVEAAQRQHADETRRALEAAEGGAAREDEPRR
jgi:hypothetical protein